MKKLYAKIVQIENRGSEHERQKMQSRFKVGDVFEVKEVHMGYSYTYIEIADDWERYNSVFFDFYLDEACTILHEIYKDPEYRGTRKSYLPTGEVKQVLLCVHGLGGSKESSAICELGRVLPEYGVAVIAFDLPQHGKYRRRYDTFTVEECIRVVEKSDAYVRKTYPDVPVSIFATSFGAYLALCCMDKNKYEYKSVILRAPAVHMSEIFSKLTQADKQSHSLKYNIDFEGGLIKRDLAKTFSDKGDNYFYVIQGKKDELVDWRSVEHFFRQRCPDKHKFYFFEDADHRFKGEGELDKIVSITKEILL